MGNYEPYVDRLFDLLLQVFEIGELGLSIIEDSLWFIEKIIEKTPRQEERDAFSLIRQAVNSWMHHLRMRRAFGETAVFPPQEIIYWKKAAQIFSDLKKDKLSEITQVLGKLREAEDNILVGDFDRAIFAYREAEETLEKLGKKAALTAKRKRLNIQAEIFYSKQEFQKASEILFQIAEILGKTGFQNKEATLIRAHELLVLHEGNRGNWEKVSEHQMEIAQLLRLIGQEEKALIAEYYAYTASARSAEEQEKWELAAKKHLKTSEILNCIGNPVSALYAKLNYHICKEKAENKSPKWLNDAEQLTKKARTKSAKDTKELEKEVKEILALIEQEKQIRNCSKMGTN